MKAVKVGDIGTEHDGFHPTKVTAGSGDVFIDGVPAARVGDPLEPHDKPKNPPHGRVIATGSSTVFINGRPAGITGGAISCGGVTIGSGTVNIGDVAPPEVPLSVRELPKKKGYKTEVINATPATATFTPKIIYIPIDDEGNEIVPVEDDLIETASGKNEDTSKDRKFKITDIPTVMRNTLNWPKSAELMELWFSLPAKKMTDNEKIGKTEASEYPAEYTNTTMFTWEWLEKFKKVREEEGDLKNRLNNSAAKNALKRKFAKYLNNYSTDIPLPHTIQNELNAVALHSEWQYQRKSINYVPFDDIDDLYGSLGSFGLYAAVTKCTITKLTNHIVTPNHYSVHVTEVGIYMRDTYDFNGNQYLGHWNFEGLDIDIAGGVWNQLDNIEDKIGTKLIDTEYKMPHWSNTTNNLMEAFGNTDYQKYRSENSAGGDLLLFSDVKTVPVDITISVEAP
jgi:uncharacterized Zn-binding protein involved in type VI secretion